MLSPPLGRRTEPEALKLGVPFPIIRTMVFWGVYWGPLILGNYHMLSNLGLSMEVGKFGNQ